MDRYLLAFLIAILVALSGSGTQAVAAGTPDGTTPANEGVCDPLVNNTPGLYGLCVAYCEAQDLDVFEKDPPARQILDNYRKKMRAGDPDMPCVQPAPCPCWTEEEIQSFSGSRGIVACDLSPEYSRIEEDDNVDLQFAVVSPGEVGLECGYYDETDDPITARYMEVTESEAAQCAEQIVQRCGQLGF